jgi:hypothetical protein
MPFFSKPLVATDIVEVYLIIDGIYYVVDHVFGKYPLKHDRNMFTKTKTSTRNL